MRFESSLLKTSVVWG